MFLILLGAAAAEASQITGSLLIFALLVLPPATAQAITSRPALGLALSVAIALLVTWTGLAIAYYSPYPIGFWITSIAFVLFVVARAAGRCSGAAMASCLVTILADVLDVAGLFSQPFMRYALLAGTAIALAAGLAGYFVVLRGQVFTGDALSHAAFAGALAALAAGIDLRVGLFAAVVGVAIVLGVLGDRGRADDVVVGAVFAWVLGLGVLFLSLFTANNSSDNGAAGVNVLFGSIFGFDSGSAWLVAFTSIVIIAVLVGIARPLLFASIEPLVAEAAGVPVRVLSFVFLVLVAVTAGMASQAVGALLLLALLAAPAAAAQRLAVRPYAAMGLSAGIAIASMWIGLAVSYRMRDVPPSFSITATLTACYTGAVLWSRHIMRGDDRRPTG